MDLDSFKVDRTFNVDYQILSFMYKWKVSKINMMYEYIKPNLSIRQFRRKVYALIDKGLLDSKKFGFPLEFVVFLGEDYLKENYPNLKSSYNDPFLYHECLVTQYGLILEELIKPIDVTLSHDSHFHEGLNMELAPDAIFLLQDIGKVAFELELTQKSRTRIYKKFSQYLESDFTHFLYLFCSDGMANSYRSRANEFMQQSLADNENMREIFLDKMIFINAKNILSESECLLRGKRIGLIDLLKYLGGKK